jgi:hypothetical protein
MEENIHKTSRNPIQKCALEGCKFKCSSINAYCGKHQVNAFIDETAQLNKKHCYNVVRGCRSQLDLSYKYSCCEACLEKQRLKDKAKRSNIVQIEHGISKICSICTREYPNSHFIKGVLIDTVENEENKHKTPTTKTCATCRTCNTIQNKKRDREHTNEIARKNDKKPERIAVKEKWREENSEKVSLNSQKSRGRKIIQNQQEYLEKQASNAKRWRENNPEKQQQFNNARNNSIQCQYKVYMGVAKRKNLAFEITPEDYETTVKMVCYYCHETNEKGFNGLDRINQRLGYTIENCVSCCSQCNYMKGSMSKLAYIQRACHISTKGNIPFWNAFTNNMSVSFSSYMKRAVDKGISFNITIEEFNDCKSNPCYICGKVNTQEHTNGIDRINNDLGYEIGNISSCCGACNTMKKAYTLESVLDKLNKVYYNHATYAIESTDIIENRIIMKSNKKSKEQLGEEAKQRKVERMNAQIQKYSMIIN